MLIIQRAIIGIFTQLTDPCDDNALGVDHPTLTQYTVGGFAVLEKPVGIGLKEISLDIVGGSNFW